ncbi:maleate cis-trans isomerase family protein [Acuticoccus mangrovi]|uniref:Aspartate/glutamate racemase family protein n=1 Tax=Acuticoccus mangrovi TaxID=2796142 RepID=A0A934IKT6_9HYPH|nr:aspartate/glutamate racemase family protein [Acuticoccus mangrovi]MBJ3774143.1 aspartate/glutamate racemase family protein [Acuticoccus mangrovi]
MSAPTRPHRIGLIVPSSNTVMENDLHRSLPKERFTVHTSRMYLVTTTREAEIEMIEAYAPKAAEDVGTADLDLLVFGCTSAGSLFGLDYDRKVCAGLGERAKAPVLGTISAVSEALDRRAFARIAVITPYIDDLTQAVADAATAPGREVVAAHGMGIHVNVALADPTPEDILAFAKDRLAGEMFDGIFVSCTNFRSLEAVPALEAAFGVPVVTSNRAVLEAIEARFA